MERNKNILPSHWHLVKLGDICDFTGGGTPSKKEPRYWNGSISWASIKDMKGKYLLSTQDSITETGIKESATNVASPNEIIIATRINPGRPIISKIKAAINQDLKIVKPKKEINNLFLYYGFLNFEKEVLKLSSGSTVLGITLSNLNTILFPFPPLPEQKAIVAKIEELLSELDNGKQQLLTAQQQLKVYRQSLLKWAFEGKLCRYYDASDSDDDHDKMDHQENQGNHNNQKNHSSDNGELPKGWKIMKLSDLGTWKGGGTPSKLVNKYWENGSNLWVTSKDMKIGVINDSINKITDEAILNSSANKIPKGAILFVMRSGILRHTFPVAIAGKDLTVNQDLQTLTPNSLAKSEFIYWYIRAFNNEIRQKCSKDGTTVESIESSSLKNYPFILPPLPEQQLIVSELESKLTICDKIEETISQSLLQAETLRQSILKQAFEGKLVNTKD